MPNDLGERIRTERERLGVTLRGFAESVGISAAFLVDIEKNRRLPNAALLQKIADKLDIPVATFDEFSPELPKPVRGWLDRNPTLRRILNLIQKAPDPEAVLAHLERSNFPTSRRKFPIAIYASELQAIGRESRNWSIETGGDLFGVWRDIPVIYLATQAGPNSKREDTHFRLDVEYLIKISGILERDWGLRYFGDWHSHHNLGLKRPSGGDQKRIINLAAKNHFDAMAEFIVTFPNASRTSKAIEIHPFAYLNLPSEELTDISLIIISGISPIREALVAASLLPEQGFSKFSAFALSDVVTPHESLGRISVSEGALVEEVTERLLSNAKKELANLVSEEVDIELHKQPFGFILVVPIGGERNLAAAFDRAWPHKLLQVDWMDRSSGSSEEINCDLSGASLVAITRVSEILNGILKSRKGSAK